MVATAKAGKRKTYSIAPDRAVELARVAIDMSEKAGKTVGRQDILDALVGALSDKAVYAKVLAILKKA